MINYVLEKFNLIGDMEETLDYWKMKLILLEKK